MKIVHTGDWHIGKLVHGIHMTEEQRYVLDKFIEFLKEEKPDVLIIAGDVYDRSIPPVEAVELLDEFLSTVLIDLGIKVMAIAGNHDSPDRLAFGSKILEKKGLYICGELKEDIEPIVFEDEYGKVNFYLIPYLEPAIIREKLKNEDIKTHDDAYKEVLNKIKLNIKENERNVLITHAYLGGGVEVETSESERPLSIGGSDIVSVDYFKEFDYVALGHIHKPQKVKYNHIRYAGSLMKYSFSEYNQKKSFAVVNIGVDGCDIQLEPIQVKRDMRKIKGELEQLTSKNIYKDGNNEDYIMAILTDKGEVVDAIGKLRAVYPNVLRIERESLERINEGERTSAGQDFVKKNPYELFKEFYENIVGQELDEIEENILKETIGSIEREGRAQ